jgi:hypothetical protein
MEVSMSDMAGLLHELEELVERLQGFAEAAQAEADSASKLGGDMAALGVQRQAKAEAFRWVATKLQGILERYQG